MKVLDVNLLLYAANRQSHHHEVARKWLETTMNGHESIGLPWVVVLGFIRISTNPRIMETPLSPENAMAFIAELIGHPLTRSLNPGTDHFSILKRLIEEAGTAGNLTTDAHLAALAIENGATLYSTDADFGRFQQLRWSNPLHR